MKLHIILGPGRSGTSALASTLCEQGVAFGKSLVSGDGLNRSGYFENPLVAGINQLIMLESGSFNGDFLLHQRDYRALSAREQRAMDEEFARSYHGTEIGLKCPRFCATYRSWAPYLESHFSEIEFYVCLRHPLAVARSLVGTGRSPNHALLWWCSYIIASLEVAREPALKIVLREGPAPVGGCDLEVMAADLWEEIRSNREVCRGTDRAWRQVFESHANWLPIGSSVGRSLSTIRTLAGAGSPLAGLVKSAFPGFDGAWSARGDYLSGDSATIWEHYLAKVGVP